MHIQPQGKGVELLLGLMGCLLIDYYLSAMHDFFFFLCFSSTLAIPVPVAAASVLDMFTELCPKLNSLLGRENAAQLHGLGGESKWKKEVSTVAVILIK